MSGGGVDGEMELDWGIYNRSADERSRTGSTRRKIEIGSEKGGEDWVNSKGDWIDWRENEGWVNVG